MAQGFYLHVSGTGCAAVRSKNPLFQSVPFLERIGSLIDEVYFWATHSGAELDLLLIKNGTRVGVECKRIDAPRLTPAMRTALADLELNKLVVVYSGTQPYKLADNVRVLPLSQAIQDEASL